MVETFDIAKWVPQTNSGGRRKVRYQWGWPGLLRNSARTMCFTEDESRPIVWGTDAVADVLFKCAGGSTGEKEDSRLER